MTRSASIGVAICFGLYLLVTAEVGAQAQRASPGAPPLPPARSVPGVNAPDHFPKGCVGCHAKLPEMDVRLSTLMEQWTRAVDPALLGHAQATAPQGVTIKGKHPAVSAALKNIPEGCLSCHGKASQVAPPFGQMLHRIHLLGGEGSHFMTLFQGECTHCHKLDAATGRWVLRSGPEPERADVTAEVR